MNTSKLSDFQLYELLQNEKLNSIIREAVSKEHYRRNWSEKKTEKLDIQHKEIFVKESTTGLTARQKLLLFIFPFFTDVHSLISGRMLSNKQKQKWKDYWLYVFLGYLFWTILVVVIAKFLLNK